MAKRWSANSLVGQVLLICLVGTNVEVLGQKTKKTQPQSYPGQNPPTNYQPVGNQNPGQNPPTNYQPGANQYPGQNPQTTYQPGAKKYPGQNAQTNVQTGSQSSYSQYPKQNSQQSLQADKPGQLKPRPPQLPQLQLPPQIPKYPGQSQLPLPPQIPKFPGQSQLPLPPQIPKFPGQSQLPLPPQIPKFPGQSQLPLPPQKPKYQGQSQPPLPPQKSKHPGPPLHPQPTPVKICDVENHARIQCGRDDISAAECEAIDCCSHGNQCFFGKAVTVLCTKDAQFVVVVAKDATLPNLNIETISLSGEGRTCTSVDSNSEFAIFQFHVTDCGSAVTEEPGVITYTNAMTSSYEVGFGPNGIITRDSSFELLFQCRYTGIAIESVVIEVLPLGFPPLPVAALGPIRVQLRLGNGQCSTKGCDEIEAAYTSFYTDADYPVTEVLRDPVYVDVHLLEKTDPNLVLTLGRCWVTNSPNPHNLPQWDLLIDGCPYSDDRYLTSLVPVGPSSGLPFPTHCRRFIFKMFTFVDSASLEPLKEEVYIHCSTAVCTRGDGRTCEPSCHRKYKREAEATHQTRTEPKLVVTVGPVTMVDHSHLDTS